MTTQRRPCAATLPTFRLISLLVMLCVIGMTIYKFRSTTKDYQPVEDRYLKVDDRRNATVKTHDEQKQYHAPDQDAEEFKAFICESESVLVKSLELQGYESAAYWRIISWVQAQSLEEMRERQCENTAFRELINHPNRYRGRTMRVKLLIRRASSYDVANNKDDSKKSQKLYELWGWPAENDGWLYVVVTPELPDGFPLGGNIEATAVVYGYFLKLQGYYPVNAKPDSPPLAAPLMIGRIEIAHTIVADTSQSSLVYAILILGGLILAGVIAGWIFFTPKKQIFVAESNFDWPVNEDADIFNNKPSSDQPSVDAGQGEYFHKSC
jgi:hypothetical protein